MILVKYLIILIMKLSGSFGDLVDILGNPKESGIGSEYGQPGDIYAQQTLACATKVHVDSNMHVCASRWLPCGTILIIQNTRNQDISWCSVMDRGPYGAWTKNDDGTLGWAMKLKPSDPDTWRGILDMSPAVVKGMDHNGFEKINYWILLGPEHPVHKFLTTI